jgi:hypothetical protein
MTIFYGANLDCFHTFFDQSLLFIVLLLFAGNFEDGR